MGVEIRVLILVGIASLCLAPVSYAATGTATFYTPPYVPSSCNGFQNDGVMIAAASDVIWDNRAACGRMYSVRCTGPTNQGVPQPCTGQSVVVKVVDYCPPGCASTIDLSQEAFTVIADPNAGKINIEYNQV
ncbi:EG45-like domain containing protein [Rhododendron vialii]|uniref:EG45-like domain containing protein n=1 Tax=Rhododendron vialii TaxID=182163 RepID=UPI00265E967D|nr:EG45-like domain containing protein [Rhododendron vialii]